LFVKDEVNDGCKTFGLVEDKVNGWLQGHKLLSTHVKNAPQAAFT